MQEKVMALCPRVQFFWPSLYFSRLVCTLVDYSSSLILLNLNEIDSRIETSKARIKTSQIKWHMLLWLLFF